MIRLISITFLSILFSQFDSDPRMIGLSGAYTSVAKGYQSIGVNPANLASNNALSMNLFSANIFLFNDFMSFELYNDINGANLEDPSSASYYPKEDILDQVNENQIIIEGGFVAPIPALNFAYKRFGISMVNRSYAKFDIPKDVLTMMFYGNTNDRLTFEFGGEGVSVNELGLTYAHKFIIDNQPIQVGATFKYLQGLLYLKAEDVKDEGSYFQTDDDSFSGSGRYLVRQAFGGGGSAIDLGLLLPSFIEGWNVGLSLINLGGSISWGADNLTRTFLSSYEDMLPLRQNEYYYFNYEIEPINAMDMIDLDGGDIPFSSDSYTVGILTDAPMCDEASNENLICLDNDQIISNSSLFSTEEIIDIGDGSYIVPSESLQPADLQSQSSEDINLDYPSSLRIGISKNIKNYGLLSIDTITGFDESFGNSNEFRLSIGTEIIAISNNFPIRFGLSVGGGQLSSYSFGFGFKTGPLALDLGRKYYAGVIMNKAKGVEYALNISLDFNEFSFKDIFKFNLPKIKLPKMPKLPD